jgi:4-amino-4-deoxy-L-arabinose transferase-like glycosyltransferase
MKSGKAAGILLLWLAVLAPRIYFAFSAETKLSPDETANVEVARHCIRDGLYQSEKDLEYYGLEQVRAPLVPWLLAGFFRVFGEEPIVAPRLAFAVLTSLVIFPLYFFIRRLGATHAAALAIAFLVALHPYNTLNGPRLLTEGLFSLLLMAMLAGVAGWRASTSWLDPVVTGAWLGLATLCRPTALPLVPVLPFIWLFAKGRQRGYGLMAAATALMVVSPWVLRLHRQHGAWIPITSAGSYMFWSANQPAMLDPEVVATPVPAELKTALKGMSEKERMDAYRKETWRSIRADPGLFWKLRGRHLFRFWKLFPVDLYNRNRSFREAYGVEGLAPNITVAAKIAWFAALDILFVSAAGETLRRLRSQAPEMLTFLALILGATAIHVLMTGYDRYRYPFDPLWMSLGFLGLWGFLQRRRNAWRDKGARDVVTCRPETGPARISNGPDDHESQRIR